MNLGWKYNTILILLGINILNAIGELQAILGPDGTFGVYLTGIYIVAPINIAIAIFCAVVRLTEKNLTMQRRLVATGGFLLSLFFATLPLMLIGGFGF